MRTKAIATLRAMMLCQRATMALKKILPLLVAASLLCTPVVAQADSRDEIIDGGTCIPYPPYDPSIGHSGLNWQHWLYGFRAVAFCHLTMPNDWPLTTLLYVLFTGWSDSSGVVTVRLCVHSYDFTVACGNATTMSGPPYQVGFVTPPPLPPNANGAYVRFDFPSKPSGISVSGITELIPVWFK